MKKFFNVVQFAICGLATTILGLLTIILGSTGIYTLLQSNNLLAWYPLYLLMGLLIMVVIVFTGLVVLTGYLWKKIFEDKK